MQSGLHKIAERIVALRSALPAPVYDTIRSIYRKLHDWRYPPAVAARAYVAAIAGNAALRPEDILYESFHGKSFNCSPAAICLALLDDPSYSHFTHIWAVNDLTVLPPDLIARPNVRAVLRTEPDYGDALATAGTIISNTTLGTYFARRDGQVYANTWHGVPLKRMFRFEGNLLTRHANSQRNFVQASHLLMPNAYTADALMTSADVANLVAPRVICTGAPRIDLTLNPDRAVLRRALGIAPDCQVIMVAPTWRGTIGDTETEIPEIDALLDRLNDLDANRYVTFVQMHDFVATANTRARALPAGLTTNQFLSVVDVLITDYSSIMFDFFATGRQVILFAYDLDDYKATRGLIADLSTLPAPVCLDVDAVMTALDSGTTSDADPRFDPARELYFPLDDGQASARAITQIFAVPTGPKKTALATRPRILVFGGAWKNNGITSSIINLLGALARYDVDIYLATSGGVLDQTPEYAENIRRVDPAIRIIHRAGGMNTTPDERAELDAFYLTQVFRDDAQETLLRALFTRESHRMFGDLSFDVAIDFSGYSRFWAMLIAATKADRRVIYQHNDMLSEANTRFDILRGVFAVYKYFDAIVSVSPATSALNSANLVEYYAAPDRATSVRNMIDPAGIIAQSQADLPDDVVLPEGPTRFVSVGRMSGEKAQERMIVALAAVRSEGHNAELILIGDGPLREDLIAAAHQHGVSEYVIFTGHRPNPFAILARCDCFVLSSDYEGQPMVLLEALSLQLPIIATDIAGTRSILDPAQAIMVETSTTGITTGMRDYLSGTQTTQAFDGAAYCDTVMQEFTNRVLGQPLVLQSSKMDNAAS